MFDIYPSQPGGSHALTCRVVGVRTPWPALTEPAPQLRRMLEAGLIKETTGEAGSRRSRIVYAITKAGDDRFVELAESVNSEAWEDDGFEIRFAFFSPTSSKNRIRILEGRHRRLQEKAEMLRVELERSPSGIDKYLEEWRRHSLESAMREVAWLEDMIKTERK